MSIIICTRPLRWSFETVWERVRSVARRVVGNVRGPQLVTRYLVCGLQELGVDYKINPKFSDIRPTDIVYVNERVAALRYSINLKRRGLCARLWAGPALTVLPSEYGGIMTDEHIDGILQPCTWVKDFWLSQQPDLAKRLHVWPTGIPVTPLKKLEKKWWILYSKQAPAELEQNIYAFLMSQGIEVRCLRYGSYTHDEYISALDQAYGSIHLSPSESQGFALFEAWERNVPTFVWNPGVWRYGDAVWYDQAISAPYLTPACGLFFTTSDDFIRQWPHTVGKLSTFSPRTYIEEHFSCRITAQKFLDLVTAS